MGRQRGAALGILLAAALLVGVSGAVAAQDASTGPATEPGPSSVAERLEAAFPEQLVGQPLETVSFSGDEVIAGAGEDDSVLELVDVVDASGASISDFAIASGAIEGGEIFVGLLAATVDGVPATEVVDDLTRLILELDENAVLSDEIIGGRSVTRVSSGSGLTGDGVVHVFTSGEIAWYVVAESQALEEVLDLLP